MKLLIIQRSSNMTNIFTKIGYENDNSEKILECRKTVRINKKEKEQDAEELLLNIHISSSCREKVRNRSCGSLESPFIFGAQGLRWPECCCCACCEIVSAPWELRPERPFCPAIPCDFASARRSNEERAAAAAGGVKTAAPVASARKCVHMWHTMSPATISPALSPTRCTTYTPSTRRNLSTNACHTRLSES